VRWWLRFLELFASPARKGTYPSGATNAEKDVLWEALANFGQDDRMMIPEGLDIDFLESARNGSVDYKAMCDQMDAAISKVLLSQTMTTDNGSSRSQATVHQDVADSVIESDADLICDSFNNTVARWLTDWNFPGAAYPKVWRRLESEPDLVALANRDKVLVDMGFPPTPEYIENTYGDGFEQPEPEVPPLSATQLPSFISLLSQAKQQGWGGDATHAAIKIAFPLIPDTQVDPLIEGFDTPPPAQNPLPADGTNPVAAGGSDPNTPPATPPPDLNQIASMFAAPAGQKTCKKGISCGKACISGHKMCVQNLNPEQQAIFTRLKKAAGKGGEEDKAKLDKFTADTIAKQQGKSEPVAVAAKPKAEKKAKATKPKAEPMSKSSDTEKESIAAGVNSKLQDALQSLSNTIDKSTTNIDTKSKSKASNEAATSGKGLESSLLDLANGVDPDSIKVSSAEIKHSRDKFMGSYQGQENKMSKMQADSPNISEDESLGLSTWIGSQYSSMNKVLYGGELDKEVDKKAVETADLLAAKALHKLPPVTQEQIAREAKKKKEKFDPKKPLGRYMQVDNPEAFVKQYQDALKGDGTIRESTFFATSHIPREKFGFCDHNTNLTYEVKPKLDGTGNGRYIDHFKNQMSEGEVLYPPQSKFRVVAVIPPSISKADFKMLELSSEEFQHQKDGNSLALAEKIANIKSQGPGKNYATELAKAYKQEAGKKLPDQAGLDAIKIKHVQADNKQAANYKANKKAFEASNGVNRKTNWVIQLEEI
jgi:Protein of unknown function (DUF935)/ADP-ribosyltransferase exoenzyme